VGLGTQAGLGSIFGLERFVTSDRLEKIKDWIPAFARMTEDAINVAPRRTEVKQKINSGSPVQFKIKIQNRDG
jgi:hypothetical protein